MKKENEVEMFILHILQNNPLHRVMSKEVANIIKKYNAAFTPISNPQVFMATLLFYDPEDRKNCGRELEQAGISVAYDVQVAYVDKKYLKGEKDESKIVN